MSRRIHPEPPTVWPKNAVPPPKSRYEKLNIRLELFVPDVLPEKALASSRLPHPDILYEIDEQSYSRNDREAVSPIPQSSHTLVGDTQDDVVEDAIRVSHGRSSELPCQKNGQWSSDFNNQLMEAAYHRRNMETIDLSSTITESPPLTPSPRLPPPRTPAPHTPPPQTPISLRTPHPPALQRRGTKRRREPRRASPRHSLPPQTPPAQTLTPRTLPSIIPDSTQKDRSTTTVFKESHVAPNRPLCAYESLPNDEDGQNDNGHSSDHYTSSDVSESREEKRARHFKETMIPDRSKKHKVGTSGYDYSFNDFPSTPPEVLAKRDPRTFMSGALQNEERSPSRDTTPIAGRSPRPIKAPKSVKAAPPCICETTVPGAERYRGHYHTVNGISTRKGKFYFDCLRLCSEESEDIVNIEFPVLKKECPKLAAQFLTNLDP